MLFDRYATVLGYRPCMALKLPGGRPIPKIRWQTTEGLISFCQEDARNGSVSGEIREQGGKFTVTIKHVGYPKFGNEAVELQKQTATFSTQDKAKTWTANTSRSIIIKHDKAVTLTPDDYRLLASQSTAGPFFPVSPDAEKYASPTVRRIPPFRSRRRR